MVNCLDSRGTGIVFFLLVICSSLGYSCNFENDPISSDYMKQIDALLQHLPTDYLVDRPRIISKEKKDQNCFYLITLFSSDYTLAKMKTRSRFKLEEMVTVVRDEIHFIEDCSFKIPSECPDEKVNISTVLQNLTKSLTALKPNIESNFSHCLDVKCEVEQASRLKTTIATRRHNKDHQDSTEDHTTPTVKLKDGALDHQSGEHAEKSSGKRNPAPKIIALVITVIFIVIVCVRNKHTT